MAVTSIRRPSSFFKLYAADVGVTGIHAATLGVSLPAVTAMPVGTFSMKGYTGFDLLFYGTAVNTNFKYEIVYYYEVQAEGVNTTFGSMWVPLQFATQGSVTTNVIGAETGLDGQYVENEALFADTLADAVSDTYHATGLRDLLGKLVTPGNTVVDAPEIVSVSNSAADGIAMLHGRHCTADWVRVHPYKPAASDYTTINVMARRVP